jgi:muramoyltetrapeptide carboxypeptidase
MITSRRSFLVTATAGVAAAATPVVAASPSRTAQPPAPRGGVVRPARLRAGDTVGIVCPSFATWDPDQIDVAVESLAVLGFKSKLGRHLLDRRGYFAGRDEDRAADLNAMFADPEVKAIHALRGGWGAARVLPHLDFGAIARHPKILQGYSDITALLLAIHAKTGLVTFHGPVGASQWNPFNVAWMRRVLIDAEAPTFQNVKETGDNLTQVEWRTRSLVPGKARGRLLGGNLTVLTAIIGSGYLPEWDGAILFIEDVEEAPYRIDRMLTQMALAGILRKVGGVVFGYCTDCKPGDSYGSLTINDVLTDHLVPLGVPCLQGAMIGHIDRQFTLPVGLDVELDAAAGNMQMLGPAVV